MKHGMTSGHTTVPNYLFTSITECRPDLHFRLAESNDMVALRAACFADRPLNAFQDDMAVVLKNQASGRFFLLLAEETGQGTIAGSGQLHCFRQRGEIANLVVPPDFRNQGIGTALVGILINIGRYLTLRTLEIGVDESNVAAARLYHRLGFIVNRTICVPGQNQATIMVKPLG